MIWHEVLAIAGAISASVAGIVLFIINLEKLNNYRSQLIDKIRIGRAKKMCKHYQAMCEVVGEWGSVVEILKEIKDDLSQVKKELSNNKEATTSILGDALLQKANGYIRQGYLTDEYWRQLLKEFLTYHNSGGNGLVMLKVDKALNLPESKGGEPRDVDLSYHIEVERNRRR